MPTYNPKDMAYVLQMSKAGGRYTPEEMALMQNINQSVAGGAMTGMPTQAAPQGQPMGQPMVTPQAMPQGQPMNRLAQLQAAANQQLAGQGEAPNPNMANIAKYFQGRQ
jgi:hypothetical protein